MNENRCQYSIAMVVPMFNEEFRWERDYWESILSIQNLCLLFVDDGSEDSTFTLIENLTQHFQNAKLFNLSQNKGKSEALRKGMTLLTEDGIIHSPVWIGYMDGDSAFERLELKNLVEQVSSNHQARFSLEDENYAIWMSRVALSGRKINRRASRHYTSRVLLTIIGFFIEEMPYDSQCGLKLFHNTPQFKACLQKPFRTRWFFDLEILIRMREKLGRVDFIREEPLEYWRDVEGSKIVMKQYLRILVEVLYVIKIGMKDRVSRRYSN